MINTTKIQKKSYEKDVIMNGNITIINTIIYFKFIIYITLNFIYYHFIKISSSNITKKYIVSSKIAR